MKPYLGELKLWWCYNCNLPLISKKCGICGNEGEKIGITPPGDVRIAFDVDYELINSTTTRAFGSEILERDNIALINKVPSDDFMAEVIQNGAILGSIKYDVKKNKYIFMPSIEGAEILFKKKKKKFVEVDEEAKESIIKGGSVLSPGIVDLDPKIEKDDEVIITYKSEIIAVGRALISAKDMKAKGVFAKVRRRKKKEPKFSFKKRNWSDVIEANKKVLESYEKEAINFIKKIRKKFSRIPVAVAFSGGKDSLATLLLVKKALKNFKVIFIDTGFEFKETVEHVFKVCKKLNLEMIYEKCDKFFEGFDYFKFVGRDFRWCCKVCKLGPNARVLLKNFGEALVFVGQRRYESSLRARTGRVWRNKYIKNQIAASPIQNWTALHVWLYILKEGIEFNPLYEMGFERIGCIFCPAQDMHELNRAIEMYPDLWREFKNRLKRFYSEEEIKLGVWRWRFSKKARKFREKLFIRKLDNKFFIEKKLKDKEKVKKMLKILPEKLRDIEIRENGVLIGAQLDEKGIKEIYTAVERAENCFLCGICVVNCDAKAIELKENSLEIDIEKCKKCLKCNNICPIRRFKVNLLEINLI